MFLCAFDHRVCSSLAGLNVSIVGLERALLQYTSDPSTAVNPFDLKSVPIDTAPMKDVPKQSEPVHVPRVTPCTYVCTYVHVLQCIVSSLCTYIRTYIRVLQHIGQCVGRTAAFLQ